MNGNDVGFRVFAFGVRHVFSVQIKDGRVLLEVVVDGLHPQVELVD